MTKSLFNEYEAYNDAGNNLSREVEEAVKPIFMRYVSEGYRLRDIENIINNSLGVMVSEEVLRIAIAKRRSKVNSQE